MIWVLIDEKGNLVGGAGRGWYAGTDYSKFFLSGQRDGLPFFCVCFSAGAFGGRETAKQIQELLQSEEQKKVQEEQLRLPGEIEGKKLEWKKKKNRPCR